MYIRSPLFCHESDEGDVDEVDRERENAETCRELLGTHSQTDVTTDLVVPTKKTLIYLPKKHNHTILHSCERNNGSLRQERRLEQAGKIRNGMCQAEDSAG